MTQHHIILDYMVLSDRKKQNSCDGICDKCTKDFCGKEDNSSISNLDEEEIFDPYYFSYGMHW